MTKKFWKDWQNRIGETDNIIILHPFILNGVYFRRRLIDTASGSKLIKATFNGDTVDLVIELHRSVFNENLWGFHEHIENVYLTLRRKDIKTIYFKKYDE